MTLWNPLNVFSGRGVSAADGPSATFDPSRTGDPLGPRHTEPTIGIGGSQLGDSVSTGDPRRHPIGFAPPSEQDEPRFRTEISFRRHHELPRASATPMFPEDEVQPAWQSPYPVGSADVDEVDVVDETPVAEESVPFFKREISFRRKKSAPVTADEADDEATETEVTDDGVEAAETVDEAPTTPNEWEGRVAEVTASAEEIDEPLEHEEHEADVVEGAESDALVVAEAVVSGGDAVEEAAVEPAAEKALPFYKRELSFRRKKHGAEVAAAVLAADAVTADDAHDTSGVAADVGDPADVEPEPEFIAAVEEPAESDALAEPPSFAVDDAGEPVADVQQVDEGAPASEIAAGSELEVDDTGEAVEEHLPASDSFAPEEPAAPVAIGFPSAAVEPNEEWPTEEAAPELEAVEDVGLPEDGEEVHDAELLPAAVAAEAMPDLTDVTGEEAPASAGGRFGSRKRKSEKAPKRHGGKGHKVVGLKIGASQLAAAVVNETERGHELLSLARRPLASGIVVDGEVRDEAALANAVKLFFDEEKLPKTDVRIGLSSNRIGVRTLDIDGVEDESRFDNAVRFKAHEVLPVALSESVLDYRVLEERVGEDGARTRRVLLVVAPRDQVEPYTRVSNLAGIPLASIDLEALALLRAFVEPGTGAPTPDDTASVVVSIGHESSTLLVAGGGVCEFTRVFDWGGSALEDAIASSLEVRPAEAATILRHLSLSGPGRLYENLDELTRAKATDAVRQRLTPFARELVNSLQFYQTQAESLGIGGIQITGGTSQLEGIDDALHQMIGVNVTVGDPLSRVLRAADYDPTLEAAIGSLAVPIGLAIDDDSMRGVNLLPKEAVAKKSRRSTLIAIGAPVAVAVPIAALSFLYLGAHGKVVDQQSQLDASRAELAALPQPTKPVIDTGIVGNEAVRATAVANVLGGRVVWEAVFRDMSKVLPANVWLSTMSLTAPEATTLADGTLAAAPGAAGILPAPTAVAIDGFTFTQPDVARLLARLATLPSLKRVTLTSSQSQLVGSKKVVHFAIVADLNQSGGAS